MYTYPLLRISRSIELPTSANLDSCKSSIHCQVARPVAVAEYVPLPTTWWSGSHWLALLPFALLELISRRWPRNPKHLLLRNKRAHRRNLHLRQSFVICIKICKSFFLVDVKCTIVFLSTFKRTGQFRNIILSVWILAVLRSWFLR